MKLLVLMVWCWLLMACGSKPEAPNMLVGGMFGFGGGGSPSSIVTPPVLLSAVVLASGLTAELTYSKNIDPASVLGAGGFSLSGTAATVSSVSAAGAVISLGLGTTVFQSEAVAITTSGSPCRDIAGNAAAALSSQVVTNNSTITVPESRAAAAMGPFATSSVSLSRAQAQDFGPGVSIVTCFEVTSRTGNQTIWGTAGTTGGAQEQFSNTTHALFFTNGTTMTYAEGAPPIGLNISANTHLAAGPVRGSRNGAAAVQRNAAPTYVAVTGTPSTTLGRHAGATASACTATKILWQAYLARDATDAELQAWTDTVNQLDRYRPPADLAAACASVSGSWLWDAVTDYDPTQSTSVTTIGTSPPTWTRNGTPAKTVIEAEIEYVIQLTDWNFNVEDVAISAQSGGPTYHRGNVFREFRFTTNAARFTVKGICDWSGVPNMNNLGVRQDNTPLSPLTFDRFSVWRRLDVLALSGSHAYRLIDGAQSIVGTLTSGIYTGTHAKGICSVLVQRPKTATFTVSAPAPAANRLVVMGDSIDEGQNPTTSPTSDSSIMQMRDEYPGDVIAFACGSFAHWHFDKDTTTINAFVADLRTVFAGATSKRLWNSLGTNDQIANTSYWVTRANFRTQAGALYDAIHADDASITIHARTPLIRSGSYEGSTVTDATPTAGTGAGTAVNGVILQDVRDDIGTVQSTRSSFVALHSGLTIWPTFAPSANHAGDSLHSANTTGQTAVKTAEKAYLAAAADSVGSGY